MLTFYFGELNHCTSDFLKTFEYDVKFWGQDSHLFEKAIEIFKSNEDFNFEYANKTGTFDVGSIDDIRVAFWLDGSFSEPFTKISYITF